MKHLYIHADEIEGLWPLNTDGQMRPQARKLVRIGSFSHGMTLPTGQVRPSFSEEGFRQGYIQHAPIEIHRDLDSCSPKIIEQFLKRTVIEKMQIVSCELVESETGGLLKKKVSVPTPLWLIRLGHVMITDFRYGPTSGGHQESLTLEYRSIQWSFRPLMIEDRQPGAWIHTSWDGELNEPKNGELDDLKVANVTGDVFSPKLDKLFEPE